MLNVFQNSLILKAYNSTWRHFENFHASRRRRRSASRAYANLQEMKISAWHAVHVALRWHNYCQYSGNCCMFTCTRACNFFGVEIRDKALANIACEAVQHLIESLIEMF